MRILSLLLCCLLPAMAQAQPDHSKDYVALYGGYYDISMNDGDNAVQVGADYRFASIYRGIRPAVGGNVSTDGSVYGYGGLFWDLALTDSIILTPNFVAGAYGKGDGKDLGHVIEFRSGIELSYQFENERRMGVHYNHISNAGIGSRNPGAETLMLVLQQPIN
jgi:lipid A 3-O-deacylase